MNCISQSTTTDTLILKRTRLPRRRDGRGSCPQPQRILRHLPFWHLPSLQAKFRSLKPNGPRSPHHRRRLEFIAEQTQSGGLSSQEDDQTLGQASLFIPLKSERACFRSPKTFGRRERLFPNPETLHPHTMTMNRHRGSKRGGIPPIAMTLVLLVTTKSTLTIMPHQASPPVKLGTTMDTGTDTVR